MYILFSQPIRSYSVRCGSFFLTSGSHHAGPYLYSLLVITHKSYHAGFDACLLQVLIGELLFHHLIVAYVDEFDSREGAGGEIR